METGHLATWVFAASLYAGLIVLSHSLVVHVVPSAWRAVDRAATTTRQTLAPQAGRRTQVIGLSENVENVAAAEAAPAYRGNGPGPLPARVTAAVARRVMDAMATAPTTERR